jgi:hypothetical protein
MSELLGNKSAGVQSDVHPADEPVTQDGVFLTKWNRKVRPDGAHVVEAIKLAIDNETSPSQSNEPEAPVKRGRGRPRKDANAVVVKTAKKTKPVTKKTVKKTTKKVAAKTKLVVEEYDEDEDEELEEDDEDDQEDEDCSFDDVRSAMKDIRLTEAIMPGLSDAPPSRQANPTLNEMQVLDDDVSPDLSSGPPKTLEDLLARFPVGDGQHFVRVNRKQPKSWQGYACAGLQRPIKDPVAYEDFVEIYGGGEYSLVVLGPPRKGGIYDPATGKLRPKALTGEVVFTVPWDVAGYGGYAPNPESSLVDVEAEDAAIPESISNMRFQQQRGPVTPATAAMFKTQIEADERREERLDRTRRDREDQDRKSRDREFSAVVPVVEHLKEMGKSAVDIAAHQTETIRKEANEDKRRLMDQAEELRRELREREERAREREERLRQEMGQSNKLDFGGIAQLLETMRPKEDSRAVDSALESARAEVTRVQEAASREMERVMRTHNEERKLFEDRMRDERDRADRRVREAEETADRRVAEAERRSERLVQESRTDADRQLKAQETLYQMQLNNADKNLDRDRSTLTTAFEARVQAEKAALEAKISTLEHECKRRAEEAERFRNEADANRDIVKKIQEFSAVAEQLGFSKGSESSGGEEGEEAKGFDWKGIISSAMMQGITTLPAIISNAGEAAARLKGAPPPQQLQSLPPQAFMTPSLPPMPQHRSMSSMGELPFASEGGGPIYAYPHPSEAISMPPAHMSAPPPQPQQYNQPRPARRQPEPTQAIVPAANEYPGADFAPSQAQKPSKKPVVEAEPQPSRASRRHAKSAERLTKEQPSEEEMGISNDQILAFRSALEAAINQGEDPVKVATDLKSQYGFIVGIIAKQLDPKRVAAAVLSAPDGGAGSPLVSPEGQAWLTKLQSSLK